MNKLNLRGRRTDILLRTMGQEKVVGSHVVSDLEVAGLNSDCACELPDIYTQKNMPVHRGNIPRQRDLQRWPHLKHVQITEIDSDIDLLIGTKCSQGVGTMASCSECGWGPIRGENHARLDSKWTSQRR